MPDEKRQCKWCGTTHEVSRIGNQCSRCGVVKSLESVNRELDRLNKRKKECEEELKLIDAGKCLSCGGTGRHNHLG